MECDQVAVHGDPAHAHCLGDVFDGATQHERAQLVESADRLLLAGSRKSRKQRSKLGFHHGDDAVE